MTFRSCLDHYTFTLRCKQRCPSKLGNVNGDIHENLLASHYHYLQFAYYKCIILNICSPPTSLTSFICSFLKYSRKFGQSLRGYSYFLAL